MEIFDTETEQGRREKKDSKNEVGRIFNKSLFYNKEIGKARFLK
jgi:hypothetical protein